jgi:hypothetical protein
MRNKVATNAVKSKNSKADLNKEASGTFMRKTPEIASPKPCVTYRGAGGGIGINNTSRGLL